MSDSSEVPRVVKFIGTERRILVSMGLEGVGRNEINACHARQRAGSVTVHSREGAVPMCHCTCGLIFLALSLGEPGHQSGLLLLTP